MKPSRLVSALFVMLALAVGTLAAGGCTSATDAGASSTSSSGGY